MSPGDRLFAAHEYGIAFGRNTVLKSASVWVSPGKITVLFGRNGCGKSTLLRCALGLVRASHGVTEFAGTRTPRPRLAEMATRGLFFLPDGSLLPRRGRVGDLVRILARARGSEARVDAVMERLGVAEAGDRSRDRLSGGERRRAEWAGVLLSGPRCVIADEPLAGIQRSDRETISQAIREMANAGAGVLVTGHDIEPLLALADEVVWMTAGTTHGLGTPAEARAHDQFRREYLGNRG